MKRHTTAAAEAILTIIGEDLPRVGRLAREVRRVVRVVVAEVERDVVNRFVLDHERSHTRGCPCSAIHEMGLELRSRKRRPRRKR